jgi:4-methylaminobutanoate oxidase (formaldehyde-forming)
MVLMQVEGAPLILHDEPVWEGERVVGLTTSGGRGARTGLTLALALIAIAPGETLAATAKRGLRIEVAGAMYPARALRAVPFDPKGERMRG